MAGHQTMQTHIRETLTGDALHTALDFAAFLQAEGMSLQGHGGGGWSITHGEQDMGFVLVNGQAQVPGPWTIWFNSCDFGDGDCVDKGVKQTAWDYANLCGHFGSGGKDCGCGDQPGFTKTIFGKEFANRCHSPLMFTNPDASVLGNVKKLMMMLV